MSKRFDLRPRGVSIEDIATYVGLTVKGYRDAVRRGIYPGPMVDPKTGKPTSRYDLKAVDLAMDRMSGIESDGVSGKSAYEKWIVEDDSGELPLHPTS